MLLILALLGMLLDFPKEIIGGLLAMFFIKEVA